jgi:hypothetical protein
VRIALTIAFATAEIVTKTLPLAKEWAKEALALHKLIATLVFTATAQSMVLAKTPPLLVHLAELFLALLDMFAFKRPLEMDLLVNKWELKARECHAFQMLAVRDSFATTSTPLT